MATPFCSPQGMLRRLGLLRSALACILLALLVAGAASYTHGSRYALVGHGPFLAAPPQVPASFAALTEETPEAADLPAGETVPASDAAGVPVTHYAGPQPDSESLERDCCERRLAPRGEPVPLRTGAVDAPFSSPQQVSGEVSALAPRAPDLSALTVIQLSVSRT